MTSLQDLPDLYEASIAELQTGLEAGNFSSVDLVKAYLARIAEVNTDGPALRAVLETNPSALKQAAALDEERKAKGIRSPLHGIPLLVKDNIATLHEEGMNTTAGSHALMGSVVPRDATVAAKLREAGAIFIGKAQLSEWANFRGQVPSGFSGRGGQATNPYYPKADASGSSSGSGIGTAIGLAADEATLSQPKEILDYTKALDPNSLKGVRLGVTRLFQGRDEDAIAVFNTALETLKELGAEIVDPADFPNAAELLASTHEELVLKTDFKVDLQKYLDGLVQIPTDVRSLADIIAFNTENADKELVEPYWTSQQRFIGAEATSMDEAYFEALAADEKMGREEGIDATLKKFNVDALVAPSIGRVTKAPAIAGYPIVCVPLGFHPDTYEPPAPEPVIKDKAPGLPFSLCFVGTAWSEFNLISYAYAYEQKTQTRLKRLAYPEAIPKTQLKDVIGS
ncbi:hypothetical protein M422DRAFT_68550 [Sphaerobolus stellatus SS14]|uniref:Amidase domain-containing protein n=1 Tax=Sphaerobolus stellatus (strain SS14) TaxID=990650 RepID=A0A0C9VRB4_SPHS4|nr:hypothetical protein M422DRAFT_68550 [Sphaerobolus stellatus SS14]